MAKVKMPDEYPDNSNMGKEVVVEPEHKEPKAILRKKSTGKKIAESIMPKSDRKEITDYILLDVALPALKDTLSDMIIKAVEMVLYPGESRPSSRNRRDGYHRSYGNNSNKYSASNRRAHGESGGARRRKVNLDEVLFYTRKDAKYAYDKLLNCIDEYGNAKVSDLFDEVGITLDWPADDVGWEDLPDDPIIDIVRVRNESGELERKYCLNLPNPYKLS